MPERYKTTDQVIRTSAFTIRLGAVPITLMLPFLAATFWQPEMVTVSEL